MTRVLAAILLLCTQVLSVFGTGNLVLCVHEDGASAIELAGSECCREARAAERRDASVEKDAARAVLTTTGHRCRDVAWEQGDTLLARCPHAASRAAHEAVAALPAAVAWTSPVVVAAIRVAHESSRGPPREAVPRRARPVVLRC